MKGREKIMDHKAFELLLSCGHKLFSTLKFGDFFKEKEKEKLHQLNIWDMGYKTLCVRINHGPLWSLFLIGHIHLSGICYECMLRTTLDWSLRALDL